MISKKDLSMCEPFELCLFTVDPNFIRSCNKAKIDTFIIDWEVKGKEIRQKGFDTEINSHTILDLKKARSVTQSKVICRINPVGMHTDIEIASAIKFGADEILIPMVRTLREVKYVLKRVGSVIGVGILIETNAAIQIVDKLNALPLTRIYIGLNDLAIENRSRNIFTPLVDGTIDGIRKEITIPFGIAGLTLPDFGKPIACKLLIKELIRLDCQFSFLRRSFLRDIEGKDLSTEIYRLKTAIKEARFRTVEQIQHDRKLLIQEIQKIDQNHKILI